MTLILENEVVNKYKVIRTSEYTPQKLEDALNDLAQKGYELETASGDYVLILKRQKVYGEDLGYDKLKGPIH